MIKKEKGSALLTVILIVFVTATIGSAISSFIMINYKLRVMDKNIGIAEYEVETIQTLAYAEVVDKMENIIKKADSYANSSTSSACADANIEVARNNPTAALNPELEGWSAEMVAEKVTSNTARTITGVEPKLKLAYFEQSFIKEIETALDKDESEGFFKKIFERIASKYGEVRYTYDESEFNEYFVDRFNGVGLYFKRIEGTNNFTLEIYYKKENVTPVYLNGDFIINTPICNTATNVHVDDKYDVINYVGITNVEFKDWGI